MNISTLGQAPTHTAVLGQLVLALQLLSTLPTIRTKYKRLCCLVITLNSLSTVKIHDQRLHGRCSEAPNP